MYFVKISLLLVFGLNTFLFGKITVGDLWLSSGVTNNAVNNATGSHFDTAFTAAINFKTDDTIWDLDILLNGGVGQSRLGFVEETLSFSDITLSRNFNAFNKNFRLSLGSYDLPMGLITESLSNNAIINNSPFLHHPIYMDALVSAPVGTLNTVGVKIETESRLSPAINIFMGDTLSDTRLLYKPKNTLSFSNGLHETSYNTDNRFLVAGSYSLLNIYFNSNESEKNSIHLNISGFFSDDSQDNILNNPLAIDSEGKLVELYMLNKLVNFKLGVGDLYFENPTTAIKNKVSNSYLSLDKVFFDKLLVGFRYSSWKPDRRSGDTLNLPQASYFKAYSKDTRIKRYQASLKYFFNTRHLFTLEIVDDQMEGAKNMTTISTFISVLFGGKS